MLKLAMEARCLSALECSVDNGTDTPNATRGAFLWLANAEQSVYPVPASYRPAAACAYSSTLAALTETAFITMLEAAYKARNGKLDLDGFVGIELKGRMDNWTARDTEASASAYPLWPPNGSIAPPSPRADQVSRAAPASARHQGRTAMAAIRMK